jgi:hypothetical protein
MSLITQTLNRAKEIAQNLGISQRPATVLSPGRVDPNRRRDFTIPATVQLLEILDGGAEFARIHADKIHPARTANVELEKSMAQLVHLGSVESTREIKKEIQEFLGTAIGEGKHLPLASISGGSLIEEAKSIRQRGIRIRIRKVIEDIWPTVVEIESALKTALEAKLDGMLKSELEEWLKVPEYDVSVHGKMTTSVARPGFKPSELSGHLQNAVEMLAESKLPHGIGWTPNDSCLGILPLLPTNAQ